MQLEPYPGNPGLGPFSTFDQGRVDPIPTETHPTPKSVQQKPDSG